MSEFCACGHNYDEHGEDGRGCEASVYLPSGAEEPCPCILFDEDEEEE